MAKTQAPQRVSRIGGMFRIAVYVSVVSLGITALWATRAYANAEHAVQRSGLELLKQLGPTLVGPPETMSINGQPMFLSSRTTKMSVSEVLSVFERHCQARDATPELSTDPGSRAPSHEAPGDFDLSRFLTSRSEDPNGSAGQVACLVPRERTASLNALVDRLTAFAKSRDLSTLGEMRYAVARREPGSSVTHVLTIWTTGSLKVPAMFPKQGDAPGRDSPDAPRPPAAVRVLSAETADHPYALRMYDSDRSHGEVLDTYDRQMGERGWRRQSVPQKPGAAELERNVRVFVKNGAALLVVVADTPKGKTGVSLVEIGTPGHVSASVGPNE